MSGQGGSKEAPVSQPERAIIEYLKGNLRGSLSLVWHLTLENFSLARKVIDEHGESEAMEAVIADMLAAGDLCRTASDILSSRALSSLVSADAGRYWELLSDIINYLIELRGILIKALPAGEVDNRVKELSPVIRESINELLRNIIGELSDSVARLEEELDECKKKLDVCKLDQENLTKRG